MRKVDKREPAGFCPSTEALTRLEALSETWARDDSHVASWRAAALRLNHMVKDLLITAVPAEADIAVASLLFKALCKEFHASHKTRDGMCKCNEQPLQNCRLLGIRNTPE